MPKPTEKTKLLSSAGSSSVNDAEEDIIDEEADGTLSNVLYHRGDAGVNVSKLSSSSSSVFKPWRTLFCFIAAVIMLIVPVLKDSPPAHRCLAIVVLVAFLWCFDATPLHVAALLVPLPVVALGVLTVNDNGSTPMAASDAAVVISGRFMDPLIFLFLGGFTIAESLNKFKLNRRLASVVISRAGTNPKFVMLAAMILDVFLCMWISNVGAAVVTMIVVQPLIFKLPKEEGYRKALMLGLAFASDVGGMTTPIASPQNALAIEALEHIGHESIGFGTWIVIGLPTALISTVVIWIVLWWWYKPTLQHVEPLSVESRPLNRMEWFVVGVCVFTVILWCLNSLLSGVFGNLGIISLIPVVAFFGTGILETKDFNGLRWNVLMLMGGGMALGEAISSSRLLAIIANQLKIILVAVVFCFISSTVRAVIIMPVIARLGQELGGGHTKLMLVVSALATSGAMGLPVSSFPNANAYACADYHGKPYLTPKDYLILGFPLAFCVVLIVQSVGYGLAFALL